jgi:thioredoxin-like negative regulator of GroEL
MLPSPGAGPASTHPSEACATTQPEWEDAAKQLSGQFKLGVVDATQETSLAQSYGVQG